jgi:multidrug efflux system membrane fusion protein
MTRRGIIIAVVTLVCLGGGVAAYWSPWQSSQQQTPRGRRSPIGADAVPVLAATARLADMPVYLDGVGTAKALNTVTVRPQIDGKLISVKYREGQDVVKGYVLAKIDPTIYQAQYDQAVAKKAQDEAQMSNARLDLDRYQRLLAANAVNKQQADTQKALVDQLTAQVAADQAAIDNTKAILEYTNVVAPISGRTGIRLVDEGNIVHASDVTGLVVITQIKPIAVYFNLPQQNLPELSRGLAEGALPVLALASDGKTPIDTGTLIVIDNQVDQTTGTVKLKAEFPNAQVQLWPGQFVNVRLLIDTMRQVVVVPTAAVQRGPNGTFVYVIASDNTVSMRPITLSKQDDVQSVIASGLAAHESVVTTGFARLADKSKVQVANPNGTITAPQDSSADPEPSSRGQIKGKSTRSKAVGGATPASP